MPAEAEGQQVPVRAPDVPPETRQVSVGKVAIGAEVLVVGVRGVRIKVQEIRIAPKGIREVTSPEGNR